MAVAMLFPMTTSVQMAVQINAELCTILTLQFWSLPLVGMGHGLIRWLMAPLCMIKVMAVRWMWTRR
jgi:hypothetical protein